VRILVLDVTLFDAALCDALDIIAFFPPRQRLVHDEDSKWALIKGSARSRCHDNSFELAATGLIMQSYATRDRA